MGFSIIAAIGKNRELGKKNDLVFHIPEDLKYFKNTTNGHTVIMGGNTFRSLPGALKERRNIVLSRKNEFPEPVEVFHSLEDILAEFKDTDEEVFIIGGASLYQMFLPYCNKLYLTEVNATDSSADVFFPEFNPKDYQKEIVSSGKTGDLSYDFVVYQKKEAPMI